MILRIALSCLYSGAVNYRAPPAFDVVPMCGKIAANSTEEISVLFAPDHQTRFYADTLNVKINNKSTYTFNIAGQAWVNNMYSILAPGYDEYDGLTKDLEIKPVPQEFMTASAILPDPPQPETLGLIFVHHVSDEEVDLGEGVDVEVLIARYKEKYKDKYTKERATSAAGGKGKGQQQQPVPSKYKVIKELEVGCIKSASVKKVKSHWLSRKIEKSVYTHIIIIVRYNLLTWSYFHETSSRNPKNDHNVWFTSSNYHIWKFFNILSLNVVHIALFLD